MARAAIRPGGHVDLSRRCQPADIANIRRPRFKRLTLIEWSKKRIHRMAAFLPKHRHFFPQLFIVFRRHARKPFTARIRLRQRVRILQFFFCILRHAKCTEIVIQHTLQRMVRYGISQAVDKLAFKRRVSHQCCSLGDPVNPRLKLHCLRDVIRPYHVQNTGTRLNNIRTASARVCNCIMNPRTVTHVLPQKLNADIHQFHRIQCAPSLFRST